MASTISAGTTSGTALNFASDTTGILQLQTNGTTAAVTVDASQNVGIGTTSPSAKLQVSANNGGIATTAGSGTQAQVQIAGNNTTLGTTSFDLLQGASSEAYIYNRANQALIFGTNNTERMRIDSSGNLLVGTTSLNGRMTLAYSAGNGVSIQNNSGSSSNGMIFLYGGSSVGSVTINSGSTSFNTSSDYRLKENIAPMIGALDKVSALKPVTYTWKTDGSDSQGFIAHELAEIVPECVTGEKDAVDDDGKPVYQGIDTSFLVATLTAAIQELNAKIDAQAEEIKALKGVA